MLEFRNNGRRGPEYRAKGVKITVFMKCRFSIIPGGNYKHVRVRIPYISDL